MFLDYRDLVGIQNKYSIKNSIKLSTLMLLEDILIDDEKISDRRLIELFKLKSTFVPKSPNEKKAYLLWIELTNKIPDSWVYLINRLNLAQMNNNFKEKGTWFPALLYPFNPEMNQDEIEALTLLGYWIKCIDDLVDLERDLKMQSQNIFINYGIKDPHNYIEILRRDVFNKINSLKYDRNKLSEFLYRISIATYAFKLHVEFLYRMPEWYRKILERYEPLMFLNITFACILGIRKLFRIK